MSRTVQGKIGNTTMTSLTAIHHLPFDQMTHADVAFVVGRFVDPPRRPLPDSPDDPLRSGVSAFGSAL